MIIVKTNAAAASIDSMNDIVSIATTENSDRSKYKSAELRDSLSVFKSKATPKLPVSQLVDNIRQLAEKLQLVDQNSTIDVETMLSGIRIKLLVNDVNSSSTWMISNVILFLIRISFRYYFVLLVINPVVILLNH